MSLSKRLRASDAATYIIAAKLLHMVPRATGSIAEAPEPINAKVRAKLFDIFIFLLPYIFISISNI
jgi:hypothetical protein